MFVLVDEETHVFSANGNSSLLLKNSIFQIQYIQGRDTMVLNHCAQRIEVVFWCDSKLSVGRVFFNQVLLRLLTRLLLVTSTKRKQQLPRGWTVPG